MLGSSSSLFCKTTFMSFGKWKCFFQQTGKPKAKTRLRGKNRLSKRTWSQPPVDTQSNAPSLPPNMAKLLKMEENHPNFSQEPASDATKICSPLNCLKQSKKKREISKPMWKVRVCNKDNSSWCAERAVGDAQIYNPCATPTSAHSTLETI